jgi:CRP-like cAMP-binding protein/Fe-S-cluster-containing hydrogenase component 2
MSAPQEAQASPRDEFQRRGLDRVQIFASLTKDASIATLMRGIEYHACAPGATLVTQGEYTSRLWIVLQGLADQYRTEPNAERLKHMGALQAGEWFGEGSALSNHPALVSVEAKTALTLVSVEAAAFKALYRTEKAFAQMVDERYRSRSLAAHLRIVPLFQSLPEALLARLQGAVRFETLASGRVIAKQGDVSDAVYLVRAGAVKCTQAGADGTKRILGFHMDNASFGEASLAAGETRWLGTYETMAPTDLVVIPAQVLRDLAGPDASRGLESTAGLISRQERGGSNGLFDMLRKGASEGLSSDEIEIMVAGESAKGGHALVIDLTRCVRCNACVESCVAVHADRVPRLSKTGNRISTQKTLASACYHCEIPECMMSCNYGAIRRDVRGTIEFVWDNCVGCTSCVSNCPYNVIRMTDPPQLTDAVAEPVPSILAELPLIGKFFKPAHACGTKSASSGSKVHKLTGREENVAGKAVKCDLCAGMPFEACVYNCPCSAIERVAPEALFPTGNVKG